ncbi:MAG TPA: PAS domain S-box protein [Tenuifilaceae bacterium]|nr:PAS domain S-box protein [Tenuifilaceae bacterium]
MKLVILLVFVIIHRNTFRFWIILTVAFIAVTALTIVPLVLAKKHYAELIRREFDANIQEIHNRSTGYFQTIENGIANNLTLETFNDPLVSIKFTTDSYVRVQNVRREGKTVYSSPSDDNSEFYLFSESKVFPFEVATAVKRSDGFWGMKSFGFESYNVDYLFRFDNLLSYLQGLTACNICMTLGDIQINPRTGSNSAAFRWNPYVLESGKWPAVVAQNKQYFYVVNLAEVVDVSGNKAGMTFLAVDVSEIHRLFVSLVGLVSILGALSILLLGLFAVKRYRFLKTAAKHEDNIKTNEEDLLRRASLVNLFDAMENGVVMINTDFEVVYINESYADFTGLQHSTTVGEKCYSALQGMYCHTAECPLSRILAGEPRVETTEFRFKSNGEKARFAVATNPITDDSGKILGIIENFKDITEKLEVEQTLKQTEEQFEIFMNSFPLGVFIEDGITHEIIYQNAYLNDISNGACIKDFLPKEKSVKPVKSYRESTEEVMLVDSSGHWRYFLLHKFKFIGVGNNLRIGGIMIDTTERREVERYRDVLSEAIDNSPVSIVILSPAAEIEFVNPYFLELTGYRIEEVYSKDINSLDLEYNSVKVLGKAVAAALGGRVWQGEVHLKHRNIGHSWVGASFIPITDSTGSLQNIVGVMENITQHKEYEKEILLAKSKAEESDNLKSAFLSHLSHEIRTPLNAIIGFSSLLSDSDLSLTERRNLSEIIYRNSNDLLRLIENLIEISEIETGTLDIKKSQFSVNALMHSLYLQILEEDKKATNVRFSLRREVHHDDMVIYSDEAHIRQVLFHLLVNSCKFTNHGFIEFGYSIVDEFTIMFYVLDSGVGIETDKQALIFNPFRQVDESSTRQFGGMGLGLAISKHIVEKLGGKIWFNSTPGSGTNFYFTVPYIPVNSKFEVDNVGSRLQKFNWSSKTILVADDIDVNFVYLKAALKRTNAQVLWAKNGKEAVEIVRQGPESINLVLMDLVMPDMDGFEATRLIKDFDSSIPVIGQTAYPNPGNAEAVNQYGLDSLLEKPIKINSLLNELNKYLDN